MKESRRYLTSRSPSASVQTPYEIAQRYALGHIRRDEMIAALAAWPYAPDFIPSNYWDDLGISPEGAFGPTVGRALDDGLLSDDDYDAILAAMAD